MAKFPVLQMKYKVPQAKRLPGLSNFAVLIERMNVQSERAGRSQKRMTSIAKLSSASQQV